MDKPFNKCRLCLKLGDFCSIFEQDESIKLSEMVMSFANIEIFEGDGMPDRVCASCIEDMSTSYLFKLQCERIDKLLRSPSEKHHTAVDFNGFINKDFHMHSEDAEVQGENDENSVKDETFVTATDKSHEISDSTDSDMDSIKCVYCSEPFNAHGAHKCHVTCTIENDLQQSSSSETLVANDLPPAAQFPQLPEPIEEDDISVSCVLCDDKFYDYDSYVLHVNKCTTNVKLQHYVCPVCHEIHTEKLLFLQHLRLNHFRSDRCNSPSNNTGIDCVDTFAPLIEKTRKPKAVRRQIGWSIEDIYQEIECKKMDEAITATSSPIKAFFSKMGNDSFSKHNSSPKRVSFRKMIEDGKAKTSKYIQSFKKKTDQYSPLKGKLQVTSKIMASHPGMTSDSDYNSPSGTSEESWKMKQNLICACDKKVFMLSEFLNDRERIAAMINEMGGVVAENTKMEMLATHFVSVLPKDTFTGMMVCALATGKWLLQVNYVYDSFRGKRFLRENLYEWMKHPKILEVDNTSVEVAKAASFWRLELALRPKYPFEGKQILLIMKKKYRQYYQMVFKTLKAKPITYDPRTPGSCCSVDYCFVDMKVIERVKLRFFARHNVPVFPYQYILVFLLNRGCVDDEHKYLLQDCKKLQFQETAEFLNSTFHSQGHE